MTMKISCCQASHENGDEDMVETSMKHNADMNGIAVVHLAAMNGPEKVIKLLLQHDADGVIYYCG